MTRLARKTCPQCGNECLEPEIRCWACGEPFAQRTLIATSARQSPTLVGYPAPRRTRRRRWLPWVAVALGMLALGAGLHLTAFWYQSEARSPAPVALQPLPVIEDSDLRPAPPPVPDIAGAPVGSATASAPQSSAPARRARTNRPSYATPPPVAAAPPTLPAPAKRAAPAPALHPGAAPRLVPSVAPPPTAPSLAPPPIRPALPSMGGDALVAIRNDTTVPLDFDFGPDNFSGTVAPHSVVAVPLSGGEYDLALRSPARKDTLYDIRIERGRRYQVAFSGRNTRLVPE